MREFFRITDETLHWFSPLLSEELCLRLTRHRDIYAIGAVEDGVACGTLVFRIVRPAAEICMIVVASAYRRRGIARGMVEYLCRYAWETTTPVICSFAASSRHDPVYLFFAELEHFSVALEEGLIYQIPLSAIPRSRLAALRDAAGSACPFFSLPATVRRRFFHRLKQQHALLWDGLDGQDCCQPLCLCAIDGEEIKAAVFLSEDGADMELSFAWCAPGCHRRLMTLLAQAAEQLPDRTGNLRIAAVTPASAALVDKLLPKREILARYYQAAWDMQR